MDEAAAARVLWAKHENESDGAGTFHPLVCHLLDVMHVCRAIWDGCVGESLRAWLSAEVGLNEGAAARWIAFWAATHDIGKASPPFQKKWPAAGPSLESAGFSLRGVWPSVPHGTVSAIVLPAVLEPLGLPTGVARQVATAAAGHHGVFPTAHEVETGRIAAGKGQWEVARHAIVDRLARVAGICDGCAFPAGGRVSNAFLMVLAGLVSVADWIGSQEKYFEYAGAGVDFEDYCRYSQRQAHKALQELGWLRWAPPKQCATIPELFPFINEASLRPLQREVMRLAAEHTGPALVVIESPMGEGKTEAAMFLADHWAVTQGQQGCYFALPTQATSNQMFGRVRDFLGRRYAEAELQLLHGHAALSAEFEVLRRRGAIPQPREVYDEQGSDRRGAADGNISAAEWFTHRKRGLLAPFGVGTIDQALLAVLQTRHVFVRLFGLAHKTVIIDEVHAYDAYMSTLLERLLEWLAALRCSVVLLSATLPRGKRHALMEAYARGAGWQRLPAPDEEYPLISWVGGDRAEARRIETSDAGRKTLRLAQVASDPAELGRKLQAALAGGGCAAVICNTVGRAQQVYRALKHFFPALDAGDGHPELDLLHARYLFRDREQREKRSLRRFGHPDAKVDGEPVRRPHRAVLVATQIIEQSLDLDFDVMATEWAPADLLLQRAGRLHRHRRARPVGLGEPILWLCAPEGVAQGVPSFGKGNEYVYHPHVLLRTWLAMKGRETVAVPEDVSGLIEAVYDDRPCSAELGGTVHGQWRQTLLDRDTEVERDAQEARDRWIKKPTFSGEIWRMTADPREEDAPDFHQAHQALTRLAEPSVAVVCMWKRAASVTLGPGDAAAVDLDAIPPMPLIQELLRCSVTVAHGGIVPLLLAEPTPKGWRKCALLRNHKLAVFGQDGTCRVGEYALSLDPDRGLVVAQEERRDK